MADDLDPVALKAAHTALYHSKSETHLVAAGEVVRAYLKALRSAGYAVVPVGGDVVLNTSATKPPPRKRSDMLTASGEEP